MFGQNALILMLGAASLTSANPLSPLNIPNLFRRACANDNCARAVTGTSSGIKPPIATRMADCNSFFSTTVTPLATTTATVYTNTLTIATTTTTTTFTTTTSVTLTTTTNPVPRKRDVTTVVTQSPNAVPSYASACSGTSRYSSACSCFGASRTIITAPTSTVTVTSYAITTTSTTTTSLSTSVTTTTTTSVGFYDPNTCAELAPSYNSNGRNYQTDCGRLWYANGGLAGSSRVTSFRACIDACTGYGTGCAGITFFPSNPGVNCNLFNSVSYGDYAGAGDSARAS